MKIAYVAQPIDTLLPPFQNSVGYYTWGVAQKLTRRSQVVVYGLQEMHAHGGDASTNGIELKLIPGSLRDKAAFRVRRKAGELMQISSPLSTSDLLYPDYGRQVAEDLRRHPCDVVHIQHCSQYAPIIRRLNPTTKIVLQIHAEWFSQSNFSVLRERLKDVDLLLTVSDHITQKTKRDFPAIANRCETMFCGVDPEEFRWEKDYVSGRTRSQKQILFVGAVSPHKGPHILFDAFRKVQAEYANVRLEFVGPWHTYPVEELFDLQDRERLKHLESLYSRNLVTRLKAKLGLEPKAGGTFAGMLRKRAEMEAAGKVLFTGHIERSQLVNRYYDADIFVFPPIWDEGFGIPPIEAMAAGTPVVGSRSGGLLETIREGETGFLVQKEAPHLLAERILTLLRDDELREKMGRAARRWALAQFSWERIAYLLEERYRVLLDGYRSMQRERSTDAAEKVVGVEDS